MVSHDLIAELAAALQRASRLLLVAHLSPDGDSLGSLLGLAHALRQLNKSVDVFVPDGVPAKYQFLPGSETVVRSADQLVAAPSTIVVLDCGEWHRTGLPNEPFSHWPILNIDHHRTSQGIGQYNLIDTGAAATGELVWQVLTALQTAVDPDIATCLYTAIVSDTGWFRFSNTTPATHRLAAELLAAGARQELANDQMMTMPLVYLQALATVLQRLTTFADNQAAIAWLNQADLQRIGVTAAELEGLIDYPRALPGVQVAALVLEAQPGICKVSLRSRMAVDVSELAGQFGGGGHARAAGCSLPGTSEWCVGVLRAAIERRLAGAGS